MLRLLRPAHVYELTTSEILEHTRRPLSVVAVALRDLQTKGLVRRRIIEGIVFWSIDLREEQHADH